MNWPPAIGVPGVQWPPPVDLGTEAYEIENLTYRTEYIDLGMSEEFEGSLGNATAVGTVAGVVSMTTPPVSPIYDLTTRPGSVLLQPLNNGLAQLRIPYTLGDGEEVIVAMAAPYAEGGGGGNDTWYGISLNDDPSQWDAGVYDNLFWDGGDSQIAAFDGAAIVRMGTNFFPGTLLYMRLIRIGDIVYMFHSKAGSPWCPIDEVNTVTRGHAYLWVFYRTMNLAFSLNVGPLEVRWIRHFATNDGPFPFGRF